MSTPDDPAHGQEAIWEYLQNEGKDWFDGAEDRLAFLVKGLHPGTRVLNIGIGNGFLEAEANRKGVQIHSLDPSERAVAGLRQRLKLGDRAQVGYSQTMPFPDSYFDAVVASEVLEHLDDDILDRSLNEIVRVLVPGGALIGTVPAREELAAQTIVCPCCAQRFHRWGHHQSFTCTRMRDMLNQRFEVDHVFEKYFAPWRILNWKGRLLCAAKSLASRAGVHGSEENIVFRAHKSQSR
jgi:SAM-dependent methyltransferase